MSHRVTIIVSDDFPFHHDGFDDSLISKLEALLLERVADYFFYTMLKRHSFFAQFAENGFTDTHDCSIKRFFVSFGALQKMIKLCDPGSLRAGNTAGKCDHGEPPVNRVLELLNLRSSIDSLILWGPPPATPEIQTTENTLVPRDLR